MAEPRTPAVKKKAAPKTPGRRARNKEATRESIVTAALQLFESKGFEATTTREIATRAGVAEGTVFNYFETKDDIALHFFETEVDHAIAAVRADESLKDAKLEEKLFALIHSQIEFLAPYEGFIGAAFVRALRPSSKLALSPRALELRARYLDFVQDLIEESLPKRRARELSWIAPQAFWIFYLGVLLYWLHDASLGKQNTLAFLDRSLRFGTTFLREGGL
jgi:AcrR family transcriptional regulator